jgi:hypothetical protein
MKQRATKENDATEEGEHSFALFIVACCIFRWFSRCVYYSQVLVSRRKASTQKQVQGE